MERYDTHVFDEMQSPSLFFPWQLCRAFKLNQEASLEVKKLFEAGEEEMNGVLIDGTTGGKSICIFLRGQATEVRQLLTRQKNNNRDGRTYLHVLQVLNVFTLCLYDLTYDIIACGLLRIRRCGYSRRIGINE